MVGYHAPNKQLQCDVHAFGVAAPELRRQPLSI